MITIDTKKYVYDFPINTLYQLEMINYNYKFTDYQNTTRYFERTIIMTTFILPYSIILLQFTLWWFLTLINCKFLLLKKYAANKICAHFLSTVFYQMCGLKVNIVKIISHLIMVCESAWYKNIVQLIQ